METQKQRSYNEWLVVRSQQGEIDAFDELIILWQQRWYRYAFNRLRDKEASRDVLQEGLLSLSKSIGKLSDPAAFPKWSFRIIEFRCADWLRKTVREREVFSDAEIPEQATDNNDYDSQAELKLSLNQALTSMDSKLSQVLRLFYLESFSVNDIADIINIQPGTVKSRLFYARKLLAQAMKE